MADTLILGLGGSGTYVCRRLAERLDAEFGSGGGESEDSRIPELLRVDTDRSLAEEPAGGHVVLTTNAAVRDAAYRQPERFHAEWLDRETLRAHGPLEHGSGGSRMLARFLLLLPENRAALQDRIARWLATPAEGPRRVYVVASAAGGTGGILADVGYLIQQVGGPKVEARALLFVPPATETALAPNAFATLTELHYYSDPCTRYSAHLAEDDTPLSTRRAPYHRVDLLTSTTAEGERIPLYELQERAVIYLMTATVGETGGWSQERVEREAAVPMVDEDGNPQVFSTFGTEWVEYPEERLVSAVYRNLVRRSLVPWLHGEQPVHVNELRTSVPLLDPEALARQISGAGSQGAPEAVMVPVRTRLPWIHKAPPHQWNTMDGEVETALHELIGTPPGPGQTGKGPMADRVRHTREQAIGELRDRVKSWLARERTALDRIARVLNEGAVEIRTVTDPTGDWEAAARALEGVRRRVLAAVTAIRRDPFLMPWRRVAARHLALEYERSVELYAERNLRAASIPFMRELRTQVVEPLQAWSGRTSVVAAALGGYSQAWADHEAALLERLRTDEEDGRLALGTMSLPGKETPFVASTGWNLPYCRPEEEAAAIGDLRGGWSRHLVEAEGGLLANPTRSVLDGGSGRVHSALEEVDQKLRGEMEDRLRTWLSATAFQRLAERYRDPVELEFQVRRLVGGAAELPALDPPHARPAGFPSEYELVFFAEPKGEDVPSALKMVIDGANRERPTRLVPSRSLHYLTAITEHAGFALSRCPAYHHLLDYYHDTPKPVATPFSRGDVPWSSATLITQRQLRDASDVLFLAVAFGILRPNSSGEIPLPPSVVPGERGAPRFALPNEFDLGVRQLAGDTNALAAVGLAVDRTVQARGVEWCALQLEKAVQSLDETAGKDGSNLARPRPLRLAAMYAAARYDDLLAEYARTPSSRETTWLRAGEAFSCPGCGQVLGVSAEALPGACPRCHAPLLPSRLSGLASSDGFRRIPNPYVVGTPLDTGANVFVGREDIIQTVRDRLIRPAQRTILILIGERRSGKTSALKQLENRLTGDLTPVFVDMQGLTALDLPGFVWWLSWRIKEELEERGITLEMPTFAEFNSGPPDYQFETIILPEIRRKLDGGRVLLMLDEFEVLAQRVMNNSFDPRAFDYLRHLMQHSEGIEFLFAGTHILRQFAANYVTFLFNIGVFLDVDFLTPDDALRLIQEPIAAAGVTYDEDALNAILQLTGAHAYFTQMFGFHLVERLNRLRKRHVTREDVEAESGPVIAAAGAHLDHVWGQLGEAERLLIAFFVEVCDRSQRINEEELLRRATEQDPALRPYVFRTCVEKLITVGLLRPAPLDAGGRTLSLTAEVYRQWLKTAHPYSRLREEGLKWG